MNLEHYKNLKLEALYDPLPELMRKQNEQIEKHFIESITIKEARQYSKSVYEIIGTVGGIKEKDSFSQHIYEFPLIRFGCLYGINDNTFSFQFDEAVHNLILPYLEEKIKKEKLRIITGFYYKERFMWRT